MHTYSLSAFIKDHKVPMTTRALTKLVPYIHAVHKPLYLLTPYAPAYITAYISSIVVAYIACSFKSRTDRVQHEIASPIPPFFLSLPPTSAIRACVYTPHIYTRTPASVVLLSLVALSICCGFSRACAGRATGSLRHASPNPPATASFCTSA